MTEATIIQAWKNPQFRQSLSAAELASLPANPAGSMMFERSEMSAEGGRMLVPSHVVCSTLCPSLFCSDYCKVQSIS